MRLPRSPVRHRLFLAPPGPPPPSPSPRAGASFPRRSLLAPRSSRRRAPLARRLLVARQDGDMHLPVNPPVAPMLARPVPQIPEGPFSFEPKWDGFRSIVFLDRGE